MKRSEIILINKMLREKYQGCRNIRYGIDGAVNCTVDIMPNTNQSGRIFAGWDSDLLHEAKNNNDN